MPQQRSSIHPHHKPLNGGVAEGILFGDWEKRCKRRRLKGERSEYIPVIELYDAKPFTLPQGDAEAKFQVDVFVEGSAYFEVPFWRAP